jgi:hypothetical protein
MRKEPPPTSPHVEVRRTDPPIGCGTAAITKPGHGATPSGLPRRSPGTESRGRAIVPRKREVRHACGISRGNRSSLHDVSRRSSQCEFVLFAVNALGSFEPVAPIAEAVPLCPETYTFSVREQFCTVPTSVRKPTGRVARAPWGASEGNVDRRRAAASADGPVAFRFRWSRIRVTPRMFAVYAALPSG